MSDMRRERRVDPAGVVIAVVLFGAAAVIWWDMTTLQISSVYGVGPKAMPIVVATGLALLAVGNLITALRGDLPPRESAAAGPVLLILVGLAALIAAIAFGGGFIPGMTILFATTATAFGRRAVLIDLVIGFVLATVVYLLFVKLLTLSLPVGPLERLL
ncbi:MAG TPA: tripartite tricarboxylate transporter TctB family protein [Beijerinckiaceae bacterium]|nr:tripartite tricarboxylate transporter TctB family protein [Beijerinckiaceae bacterium]